MTPSTPREYLWSSSEGMMMHRFESRTVNFLAFTLMRQL